MPLFDLKITKEHILVCGGGGRPEYGVANGVLAVDRETKKRLLFQTDDIIKSIEIRKTPEEKTEEQENGKKTTDDKQSFLIAALGVEHVYLLKFNGKFTLLNSVKKTVKKIVLTQHLFILDKQNMLTGFANIEKHPEMEIEENNSIITNTLIAEIKVTKDNRIEFLGDKNKSYTAIGDVQNFWVHEDKVHVVKHSNGMTSFMEEDEVDEIQGKINYIENIADNLIYYAHKADGSVLNINGMTFSLPKITDLSINGEYMAVSTVYGDVHVFYQGKEHHRVNVSSCPITCICICGETIKYATLQGVLGTVPVKKSRGPKLLVGLAMIGLAVGMFAVLFKKKQE